MIATSWKIYVDLIISILIKTICSVDLRVRIIILTSCSHHWTEEGETFNGSVDRVRSH